MLLHQDKYKTIPYRADIATYNPVSYTHQMCIRDSITTGKDVYGALAYNQEKVDRGDGPVLLTHIVREPADGRFNCLLYTSRCV